MSLPPSSGPNDESSPRDDHSLDWNAMIGGEPRADTSPGAAAPTPAAAPQPQSRREARQAAQRTHDLDEHLTAAPVKGGRSARRAEFGVVEVETKPKRGAWGCLIALLVVIGLLVAAFFLVQGPFNDFMARFQPAADYEGSGTGEVTFMITEGDTGTTIATGLHDQGITASFDAFYDLVVATSPAPVFHPGAYTMAEKMSSRAALDALLDPANRLESTFVIPEGTAAPEALERAAEGTGIPLADLQAAAADYGAYGLPAEATGVEGFLFPATYTFDPGATATQVIQTMVDRTFQALTSAGVDPANYWNTIILASIVQREAGSDQNDFPKIARVFQNRLDQGMNLQSDATVAYGTGNTHTVWTTDEERADASNLYNTYANPGLPVGPIGNPGDVAIAAAQTPADGPWLFFVPINLDTGETVFSETVDQHDAAVQQLQDWCRASDENAARCE
ncbi:endolytic transglycosylase MltG [Agromyces atrinae]|uniref:Endolytic murein transglycosylase n=2 Tax=Agromyces atrinae TaxID=592376 RepID=A0A852S0Q6_9MICO|nr:endolytic transglycosylase MltG [Agromyces atrinae]NYD65892.1 UPF0755 protein [Agromyces atrinae]